MADCGGGSRSAQAISLYPYANHLLLCLAARKFSHTHLNELGKYNVLWNSDHCTDLLCSDSEAQVHRTSYAD